MENKNSSGYSYGFKKLQDETFPPMVFAEITNACNLNCVHCPHTYISKQKSYKLRHMKFSIYKRIVDEVAQYKGAILRLVCDGEPMLHPRLLDMIVYAKKNNIQPICLITNGTLLSKKKSMNILNAGIDVIEISLDAVRKDTYESIRLGSSFKKVMDNTQRLIDLRDRLKFPTKIMVSIIDQPEVKEEINDFVKYWENKVDKVIIRTYTSIGGLVKKNNLKSVTQDKRWPCPLLWTRIFINVDGHLKFCVEDWLDRTIVGNIRKTSLRQMWQSVIYNQLRNYHQLGQFHKIPYCDRCIDWPARKWDYDYFYALNQILNKTRKNESN